MLIERSQAGLPRRCARVVLPVVPRSPSVVCVAIWQVFRTGQTAIKKESDRNEDLRKEVDELRELVERPVA